MQKMKLMENVDQLTETNFQSNKHLEIIKDKNK